MEAIRARIGPLVEWLCAAAILAGALAAALTGLRDVDAGRAVTPVMAREAPSPDPPPILAPRSVSLPMLLLADGKDVRLGDAASRILDRFGPWAQVGADTVERDGVRERITRLYSYVGTQFALVFEAPRQDVEPRVIAIYRQ